METSSTTFRKLSQLLGYADDIEFMRRNVHIFKERKKMENIVAVCSLDVSEKKTKYLSTLSPHDGPPNLTLQVKG